jgi:hypothetical protein
LEIGELDLALVHEQFAGEAQRLERLQSIRATLGFDVVGNQFIDRRRIFALSKNCWR